jgi:hypothetical protein
MKRSIDSRIRKLERQVRAVHEARQAASRRRVNPSLITWRRIERFTWTAWDRVWTVWALFCLMFIVGVVGALVVVGIARLFR